MEFRHKRDSCLHSAGINRSNIKGHYFRRGGAAWLAKLGVSVDMIKTIGLWASDAVHRYVETDLEAKLNYTMQTFTNATNSQCVIRVAHWLPEVPNHEVNISHLTNYKYIL